MIKKICCFAGHSDLADTEEIYTRLLSTLENLVSEGSVTEFWVGNYGAFDRLSARAVREIKMKHPEIKSALVVPYLTSGINEYRDELQKDFDDIIIADIPPKTPKKLQIIKCNQYMVKSSQILVCYVKYSFGGAAKTLEYAEKRKDITVINLALE